MWLGKLDLHVAVNEIRHKSITLDKSHLEMEQMLKESPVVEDKEFGAIELELNLKPPP